jgi:AmiR/NasT family two-component response regulator
LEKENDTMIQDLAGWEGRLSRYPQEGRRVLDTAVGILVGLRRSSTHAAFEELIAASQRHGIPMFSIASALVALASRGTGLQGGGTAAELAAEREWGENYWP